MSQTEKEPATVWILSAFHLISASTITGFQFIDLSHLSAEGKVVLIVIMLVGGTAFSTAGGIKIARLVIIFKSLRKRKPLPLADTSTSISSTPSFEKKRVWQIKMSTTKTTKEKLKIQRKHHQNHFPR